MKSKKSREIEFIIELLWFCVVDAGLDSWNNLREILDERWLGDLSTKFPEEILRLYIFRNVYSKLIYLVYIISDWYTIYIYQGRIQRNLSGGGGLNFCYPEKWDFINSHCGYFWWGLSPDFYGMMVDWLFVCLFVLFRSNI